MSGLCLGVCDQWSTGLSLSWSLSCRVAKWLKAEPERRKKLEEEKRKRLAMKKGESSKHYLEDHKYMEQIKSTEENMGDALKQGRGMPGIEIVSYFVLVLKVCYSHLILS